LSRIIERRNNPFALQYGYAALQDEAQNAMDGVLRWEYVLKLFLY